MRTGLRLRGADRADLGQDGPGVGEDGALLGQRRGAPQLTRHEPWSHSRHGLYDSKSA